MSATTSRLLVGASAVAILVIILGLSYQHTRDDKPSGVKPTQTSGTSDVLARARTIDNGDDGPVSITGGSGRLSREGSPSSIAGKQGGRPSARPLPPSVRTPTYLPPGHRLRKYLVGTQGKSLLIYGEKTIKFGTSLDGLGRQYFMVEQSPVPFKEASETSPPPSGHDADGASADSMVKDPLTILPGEVRWRGADGRYYRVRGELEQAELVRIARSMLR